MAKSSFDEALARVLAHEGGYSNHPSDPGGPTNFGITIADYRKYVNPDATAADVKGMKREDAVPIYRARYWDAQRCDDLPAGLDYAVFDYGVNSGIARSIAVLQRLLGLKDDGRVSDALIAAADVRDPQLLIAAICDERLAFLKRLKTWPVFGVGWERRVREVRAGALAMAKRAQATPKAASRADAAPAIPRRTAAAAAGGGAAALALLAAVWGDHAAIVIVAACVVGLGFAGWFVWRGFGRGPVEG